MNKEKYNSEEIHFEIVTQENKLIYTHSIDLNSIEIDLLENTREMVTNIDPKHEKCMINFSTHIIVFY